MGLIRNLIIKIFVKYFVEFSRAIPKIVSIDYDGLRGMSTEITSITSFEVVTNRSDNSPPYYWEVSCVMFQGWISQQVLSVFSNETLFGKYYQRNQSKENWEDDTHIMH